MRGRSPIVRAPNMRIRIGRGSFSAFKVWHTIKKNTIGIHKYIYNICVTRNVRDARQKGHDFCHPSNSSLILHILVGVFVHLHCANAQNNMWYECAIDIDWQSFPDFIIKYSLYSIFGFIDDGLLLLAQVANRIAYANWMWWTWTSKWNCSAKVCIRSCVSAPSASGNGWKRVQHSR